ncbi:hypothetical protein BX666DRAFT_2024211 [Dichotomocladium elegans]|nr:hypothetical protein BX666DRAFT_2024211 [Dichotomocladium elegans]
MNDDERPAISVRQRAAAINKRAQNESTEALPVSIATFDAPPSTAPDRGPPALSKCDRTRISTVTRPSVSSDTNPSSLVMDDEMMVLYARYLQLELIKIQVLHQDEASDLEKEDE